MHQALKEILNGSRSATDHAFIEHCGIWAEKYPDAAWSAVIRTWVNAYKEGGEAMSLRASISSFIELELANQHPSHRLLWPIHRGTAIL